MTSGTSTFFFLKYVQLHKQTKKNVTGSKAVAFQLIRRLYLWGLASFSSSPSSTSCRALENALHSSSPSSLNPNLQPTSISNPSNFMEVSEDSEYKEHEGPAARRNPTPATKTTTTSVHVTALDGLVNVNSLFTIAVFVGLSLTSPGQRSLENNSACDAGEDVVRNLLVFEVVSFSFFLFSSLIAQGLKLAINLLNSNDVDEAFRAHINARVLRLGMLGSAIGSVMGCLFLLLSMVNVIQIRLGMLSCGSSAAVKAVATLITLVSTSLAIYISTIFYAFCH